MIRLFRAFIYQSKKDKMILGSFILMLVIALGILLYSYSMKNKMDHVMLLQMSFIGIGIACLVSVILGKEFNEVTLRNKLIIGHKKYKVYLAYWLYFFSLSVILYAIYMLVILCLGIPLLGAPQASGQTICLWIISQLLMLATFVSLFTCISFLCSGRIIAIIVNLLFAFGLIFLFILFMGRLTTPEYIDIWQMNPTTNEFELMKELNPKYPSPMEKNIMYSFLYLLPTSHTYAVLFGVELKEYILILSSLLSSTIITLIGVLVFMKKDIK